MASVLVRVIGTSPTLEGILQKNPLRDPRQQTRKRENTEQRTPPRPNNGPYIVQAKIWELKVDPRRTLSSGILLAIARAFSRWRVHEKRCAMVKLMSE